MFNPNKPLESTLKLLMHTAPLRLLIGCLDGQIHREIWILQDSLMQLLKVKNTELIKVISGKRLLPAALGPLQIGAQKIAAKVTSVPRRLFWKYIKELKYYKILKKLQKWIFIRPIKLFLKKSIIFQYLFDQYNFSQKQFYYYYNVKFSCQLVGFYI